MEKIINSAFDFFAYALPGAFLILSLLLLDAQNDTCADFLDFAQKLKTGSAVMLLALGYVLGFAVTPIGRKLYRLFNRGKMFKWLDIFFEGDLKKKIYPFDETHTGAPKMSVSERFILVREYSPNNFRHIESWHVYSLMSHNMALVNILVVLFIIFRLLFYDSDSPWMWGAGLAGAASLAVLFLYSAVKFNIWSTNELNATVESLRLTERAGERTVSTENPRPL